MKKLFLSLMVFGVMFGVLVMAAPQADAFYLRVPKVLQQLLSRYSSRSLADISTTTQSCPSGQWWDSSTSSCKSNTGAPSTSCSSGQYWNGTACVASTAPMDPSAGCTQSGGTWNTSSNYCQFPSCSTNQYWYTPPGGGTGYCKTNESSSCSSGGWWDSATNTCKSSTTQTCSGGQYWNGTTCVNNTNVSCPSGQYWNGTACMVQPATGSCSNGQYWYVPSGSGQGYCTSSSNTTYAGDANSCPGFSYSRWDSSGKRYCQLNNERRCDYAYPSYLTNSTNYKTESCPVTDNTSTNTSSVCDSAMTNLLGSGCHFMPPQNAYFDGAMNKYVSSGTTTVKECSANYVSGCSSGGGMMTSCLAGQYWYTPSSGGAGYCMPNSVGTGTNNNLMGGTASFDLVVKAPNGSVVSNATVSLSSCGPGNNSTTCAWANGTTNANGEFIFSTVSGTYYLGVSASGRSDLGYISSQSVVLTTGTTVNLTVTLPLGGTGTGTGMGNSGNWIRKIWNFLNGESETSNILNRTDGEYMNYIAPIQAQCLLIAKSKFQWKPDAGNDAAANWKNFGIPDCSGNAVVQQQCPAGQYWYPPTGGGAGYCKSSDQQANQKQQIWNSLGLSSQIRNDADPARVERLKQVCAGVSGGSNIWMPSAGDFTSVDFGMPDPGKCDAYSKKQQQCTLGQYWDSGANMCKPTPQQQCSNGQYWDSATNMCKISQQQCGPDQVWVSQGPTTTAGYCESRRQQCTSGQYWDSGANVCKPTPQPRQEDFSRIKQGFRFLDSAVKRSERDLNRLEKSGVVVSQEMKDLLAQLKVVLAAIKSAKTFEEFNKALPDGVDVYNTEQDVRDLEQYIRETQQDIQRFNEVSRGMKQIEQQVKVFDTKINTLVKKKVAVPQELLDTVSKIKALIVEAKKAKTWDELQTAGIDDLPGLFEDLNQYRNELELIGRWPSVIAQVNRDLKEIESNLIKAKSTVVRLAKKDIDISNLLTDLDGLVTSLRGSKVAAETLVANSETREALDVLDQKFYDPLNDARQVYQVISMVNDNFGGFSSEFKRATKDMKTKIGELKRNKIDTTELENLATQINTTGAEVLANIKKSGVDVQELIANIQDAWAMRNEFWDLVSQLSGGNQRKAWDVGQRIFDSAPQLPSGWDQYFEGDKTTPETPPPVQPVAAAQTQPAQLSLPTQPQTGSAR